MKSPTLIILALVCTACGSGTLGTNTDSDTGTRDTGSITDMGVFTPDAAADVSTADATVDTGQDAAVDMFVAPVVQDVITAESNGTLKSFAYDPADGTLTLRDTDTSAGAATFAAFHPLLDVVYATSGSTVRAYSFDDESGALTYVSSGTSADNGTHLEVDHTGQYVFTVSYGGDSISMLPLNAAGEPGDSIIDLGAPNEPDLCRRAHQVRVHPSNEFVYVPCLASDHVLMMAFDADTGTLVSMGSAAVPAGAGPRHMDFHPTLDRAYVLNETASSVSIFDINNDGTLPAVDTITTLPNGITAGSASSDIHVSRDGRHLYAVNRQPLHQIAIFELDASGNPTLLDHVDGAGEHARSFAIDNSGGHLLLANRNTDDLVTFSRNADTGALTYEREDTAFSQPMFVGFRDRL